MSVRDEKDSTEVSTVSAQVLPSNGANNSVPLSNPLMSIKYTDPVTDIQYDFHFNWNGIFTFVKKVAVAVGKYAPKVISVVGTILG